MARKKKDEPSLVGSFVLLEEYNIWVQVLDELNGTFMKLDVRILGTSNRKEVYRDEVVVRSQHDTPCLEDAEEHNRDVLVSKVLCHTDSVKDLYGRIAKLESELSRYSDKFDAMSAALRPRGEDY